MDREMLMDFGSLARGAGADIVSFSSIPLPGFYSVSIDSRDMKPGALFVALGGSTRDGHEFAEAAFRSGAAAVMVQESKYALDLFGVRSAAEKHGGTLIVVKDTLKGLQDAAGLYLDRFPGLVRIGITGSSGKTTTKEIAAAIIGQEKNVVMNPGNYNSETGLPLAAFSVRSHHEVGIFEMGMNRRGEIAELAAVLKPSIALITNIGTAHIGILGTQDAIAEEKKNIFSQFSGMGTALIPAYDAYASYLAEGIKGRVLFFGPSATKSLEGYRDLGIEGTELIWEGNRVRFGLPGYYNFLNALAGAAIAQAVPVSAGAVKRGLELVKPLFGRSEIIKGPVTVLRDCYNANPEATLGAIAFSDSLAWAGRKVYIIGSMLELGKHSGESHKKIGEALALSKAGKVFLYGGETRAALQVLEEAGTIPVFYTTKMDELAAAVSAYVREGDFVLLKGSRGTALESLTDILTASSESAGQEGVN